MISVYLLLDLSEDVKTKIEKSHCFRLLEIYYTRKCVTVALYHHLNIS